MGKEQNIYEPEFKIEVVKAKKELGLSLRETAKHFELRSTRSVFEWERIYDEQGADGLLEDKRGRPRKLEPSSGEETLEQEVMRLRMENEYLKKLNALVREKEKQARKKKWK